MANEELEAIDLNFTRDDYFNIKDFRNANLRGGQFNKAEFFRPRFSGADLRKAKFRNAQLFGADFSKACLRSADFSNAYLEGADFRGADLYGANLGYANLEGADFRGADLSETQLEEANLSNAILDGKDRPRLGLILDEPITGYKRSLEGNIITAVIPAGAIVFSINNRKCRTNKARIIDMDGAKVLHSWYDDTFEYRLSQYIEIKDFNMMYNVECTTGFHFLRTREEAESY